MEARLAAKRFGQKIRLRDVSSRSNKHPNSAPGVYNEDSGLIGQEWGSRVHQGEKDGDGQECDKIKTIGEI